MVLKLSTKLLIILCLCFVITGCKSIKSDVNGKQQEQRQQVQVQKKVEEKAVRTSNSFANANVGDFVEMGTYPQTAEGEVKPIEWQVLVRDDDNKKVLAISRYGLDGMKFDSSSNVWSSSEICTWLNGAFYDTAFDDTEKRNINPFEIDSVNYNVFLLSKEEAEKYFVDDKARQCMATSYAVKQGAWVSKDNGYSIWWLRSPNPDDTQGVYRVFDNGYVCYYYTPDFSFSVRPALWINF